MTYNVHSCKGRDGRISPERVAEVIRAWEPDIVGLQEVRIGRFSASEVDHPDRVREGVIEPPVGAPPLPPLSTIPRLRIGVDQPGVIGRLTGMKPLFYPLVRFREEDYGIAVLSRYPQKLVRAANLPTLEDRPLLEKRGAIWAGVELPGLTLQVLNTHLGLNRAERLAQIDALMGPEWSVHPECRSPVVVCGDLNAWPWQRAYRRLASRYLDVQSRHGRRATFPSGLPFLRIDHIFIDDSARVTRVEVPRTALTREASDHLPLIADIEFDAGAACGN